MRSTSKVSHHKRLVNSGSPATCSQHILCTCRSQHIFIDPSSPRSPYGMTYNCVAFAGNQRSFNDGYHICHHANSRLHWSQLPAHFQARLAEHAAHQGGRLCWVLLPGFTCCSSRYVPMV